MKHSKLTLFLILLLFTQVSVVFAVPNLDRWFTTEDEIITGVLASGLYSVNLSTDVPQDGDLMALTIISNVSETYRVHVARVINYRGVSFLKDNITLFHSFPSQFTHVFYVGDSGTLSQTLGVVLYQNNSEVGSYIVNSVFNSSNPNEFIGFLDKDKYSFWESGVLTMSNDTPFSFKFGEEYYFQKQRGDSWIGPIYTQDAFILLLNTLEPYSNVTQNVRLPSTPGYYKIIKPVENGRLVDYFVIKGYSIEYSGRFQLDVFLRIFSVFCVLAIIVYIKER